MKEPDKHQLADFEEFVGQFRAESDRAAVILGAAKLDYLLFQLVDRALVPNYSKDDDLLDDNRPLSSFSARISLAYRLGMIDASFAKALHLVRKIRNEFAHKIPNTRLDIAPHRDRIRELAAHVGNKDIVAKIKRAYFEEKQGPSAEFFAVVTMMVARLDTLFANTISIDSTKAWGIHPVKSKKSS